jgi:hypothetical protein
MPVVSDVHEAYSLLQVSCTKIVAGCAHQFIINVDTQVTSSTTPHFQQGLAGQYFACLDFPPYTEPAAGMSGTRNLGAYALFTCYIR